MKKIYLLLVFLLIPLVSAEAYYVENTTIDLKGVCIISGAYCDSTAVCNFSVYNPNNEVIVDNKIGTNNGAYHNYTIFAPNTTTKGEWSYFVACSQSSLKQVEEFTFNIGRELKTSDSILYGVILAILCAMFGLTLFGSFKIPYGNLTDYQGRLVAVNWYKHAKLGCIALSYVFLTSISAIAWNFSEAFIQLGAVAGIFRLVYTFLISFIYPIFILVIMMVFVQFILDLRLGQRLQAERLFSTNEI